MKELRSRARRFLAGSARGTRSALESAIAAEGLRAEIEEPSPGLVRVTLQGVPGPDQFARTKKAVDQVRPAGVKVDILTGAPPLKIDLDLHLVSATGLPETRLRALQDEIRSRYADYFAREGKRGGAWMSSFVEQSELLNDKPVVVNVMNIPKGPAGEPTLVSYDNVTTIFHELGHGLHGIFSKVKYPTLAGTSVSRDFVEFPSTFQEDWAAHPDVIGNYAKHYKTGEAIPAELLAKIMKSRSFNQGYDTLEYMSSALLDMEWHSLPADAPLQDVQKFEAAALKKHGVDLAAVPPRYKSTFFAHVFSGGYSASYYAYMWSEILAADAFAYVQTQGGLKLENGINFRKNILSIGNSKDPMEAYKAFRGQEPTTDALLIRRGLKTGIN